MKPLKLALLNLFRRKTTTYIALVSIAISVACGGLLLRAYMLSASRFSTLAKEGDAVVGAKSSGIEILLNCLNLEGSYPDFIPYNLYESLKKEASPEENTPYKSTKLISVIPFLYFATYDNFRVIGTDESLINNAGSRGNMNILEGRWSKDEGEVVLGEKIAEHENLKLNDEIEIFSWVSKYDNDQRNLHKFKVRITGIFRETDTAYDYALFSDMTMARKVLEKAGGKDLSMWGTDVLNYYIVYLSGEGYSSFEELINKRTVAQVVFIKDEIKKLEELTSTGKNLGIFIIAMIIILGGLCVAGVILTRFDAMTFQLAVLRAIGYERKEIALWLLWEGFLLGIIASSIGALIDLLTFPVLKNLLGSSLPNAEFLSSPFYTSFPVWIIAVLATISAVWIPLIKIYRQDVHLSLKGV